MKRTSFILTAIIATAMVAVLNHVTQADIVALPLECTGQYSFHDTQRVAFDLGVAFTNISNVYLDWAGEITAFQSMYAIVPSQFVASLYESDPHAYFSRAYVAGGTATYPAPEPFGLQSAFTNDDWTLLLDGRSSVEIWFGDTIHMASLGVPGTTGSISSATLVIEGTFVPEPGTVLLIAFGAFWVRKIHRTAEKAAKPGTRRHVAIS